MPQQIVVNRCYGGFSLSKKAYEELGIPWDGYGFEFKGNRTDPKLIEVVLRLGKDASGDLARLEVVTIPDNVEWTIEDYDGSEWISEVHRTW